MFSLLIISLPLVYSLTLKAIGGGCGQTYNSTFDSATSYGAISSSTCGAWNLNSCCSTSTIANIAQGNIWSRTIGIVTPACANWFTNFACLTHCDVSAGKFSSVNKCLISEDETMPFANLPISLSDSLSWYSACSNDTICINGTSKSFLDPYDPSVDCSTKFSSLYPSSALMTSLLFGQNTINTNSITTLSFSPTANLNSTFTGGNVNDFNFEIMSPTNFVLPCEPEPAACLLSNPLSLEYSSPSTTPFNYCQAWQGNACCTANTTSSLSNLYNFKYMNNFQSNVAQCNSGVYSLPPQCEAFFIAISCINQCDVNAAAYSRNLNCVTDPSFGYEMVNFPLQSSDCDNFYTACGAVQLAIPMGGSYVNFGQTTSSCSAISTLYSSSAQLCQSLYSGAFKYTVAPALGYSLFPSGYPSGIVNSNDMVTTSTSYPPVCSINQGAACDAISPNSLAFSAPASPSVPFNYCKNYQDNACCSSVTVSSLSQLFSFNYLQGFGMNYNKCGGLSQTCLNFWTKMACFYQCDVNVSKYRRRRFCNPMMDLQMVNLPLSSVDADEWYSACQNDLFPLPPKASYYRFYGNSTCKPFNSIYSSGQDFINNFFNGAFVYTPTVNISAQITPTTPLSYYTISAAGASKGVPIINDYVRGQTSFPALCSINQRQPCLIVTDPNPALSRDVSAISDGPFNYCQAYANNACCTSNVTSSLQNLFNNNYFNNILNGFQQCYTAQYAQVSASCLNWFTKAACFYSCDVNAGKYVKYNNCNKNIGDLWELANAPIRSDDCESFYAACANDMLPIPVNGDYTYLKSSSGNQCLTISNIYSTGQNFCNTFFLGAFQYDNSYQNADGSLGSQNLAFTLNPVGATQGMIDVNDNLGYTSFPASLNCAATYANIGISFTLQILIPSYYQPFQSLMSFAITNSIAKILMIDVSSVIQNGNITIQQVNGNFTFGNSTYFMGAASASLIAYFDNVADSNTGMTALNQLSQSSNMFFSHMSSVGVRGRNVTVLNAAQFALNQPTTAPPTSGPIINPNNSNAGLAIGVVALIFFILCLFCCFYNRARLNKGIIFGHNDGASKELEFDAFKNTPKKGDLDYEGEDRRLL